MAWFEFQICHLLARNVTLAKPFIPSELQFVNFWSEENNHYFYSPWLLLASERKLLYYQVLAVIANNLHGNAYHLFNT